MGPNNCRVLRERAGMSKTQLASICKLSVKTLDRVEAGNDGIKRGTYFRVLNGLNSRRSNQITEELFFRDAVLTEEEIAPQTKKPPQREHGKPVQQDQKTV